MIVKDLLDTDITQIPANFRLYVVDILGDEYQNLEIIGIDNDFYIEIDFKDIHFSTLEFAFYPYNEYEETTNYKEDTMEIRQYGMAQDGSDNIIYELTNTQHDIAQCQKVVLEIIGKYYTFCYNLNKITDNKDDKVRYVSLYNKETDTVYPYGCMRSSFGFAPVTDSDGFIKEYPLDMYGLVIRP